MGTVTFHNCGLPYRWNVEFSDYSVWERDALYFGRTWHLRLQDTSSALQMEGAGSSESLLHSLFKLHGGISHKPVILIFIAARTTNLPSCLLLTRTCFAALHKSTTGRDRMSSPLLQYRPSISTLRHDKSACAPLVSQYGQTTRPPGVIYFRDGINYTPTPKHTSSTFFMNENRFLPIYCSHCDSNLNMMCNKLNKTVLRIATPMSPFVTICGNVVLCIVTEFRNVDLFSDWGGGIW
jgi:hypothetical protein